MALGRANVYLGADEANHLVGAWGNVRSVRGGQTPYGGYGGIRNRYQPQPAYQAPQAYGNPYQPQPAYGQPAWGGGRGGFEHREHRDIRRDQAQLNALEQGPQTWQTRREEHNLETDERRRRRLAWEAQNPGIPFVGVEAMMGAEADGVGPISALMSTVQAAEAFGIQPRAALVDARPPSLANREVLPLSTGLSLVGIAQTVAITSRPQRVAYRPERLFISSNDPTLGAAAWTVNDLTIGNRSQFAQQGSLPGDMFANVAIDSYFTFETAQTAMDIVLTVTYGGAVEAGLAFSGGMLGTSAVC
jgi:hypothetical protein